MSSCTGTEHKMYMDSYYTSAAVAKELAENDRFVCDGELRPAQVHSSKGDDPMFIRNNKLLVCVWHDTKHLTGISSIHGSMCFQKRIRNKLRWNWFSWSHKTFLCWQGQQLYGWSRFSADKWMKTYHFPHHSAFGWLLPWLLQGLLFVTTSLHYSNVTLT